MVSTLTFALPDAYACAWGMTGRGSFFFVQAVKDRKKDKMP